MKQLTIYLDDEDYETLFNMAEGTDRSMNYVVKQILSPALKGVGGAVRDAAHVAMMHARTGR